MRENEVVKDGLSSGYSFLVVRERESDRATEYKEERQGTEDLARERGEISVIIFLLICFQFVMNN